MTAQRSTHTVKYRNADIVTVQIGKDDETVSDVVVELEYIEQCGEKIITDYTLVNFDKELHGMWQMELTQQLREAGYNTEEI